MNWYFNQDLKTSSDSYEFGEDQIKTRSFLNWVNLCVQKYRLLVICYYNRKDVQKKVCRGMCIIYLFRTYEYNALKYT